MHKNQQTILEFLLDNQDGATLEEISDHLGITKTAAKEHIIKLVDLGYLYYQDSKGLVGRPRRRYLLTPEGHETFPRQYSWLSNILLELLSEDLGPEAVAGIMRKLADKVANSMKARFQKSNPKALLVEINGALNELGYRTVVKQSDFRKGAILEATNCVYHNVAKIHPELCKFDTQFIRNATGGMSVSLESCIARGGTVCRFCIRKKD